MKIKIFSNCGAIEIKGSSNESEQAFNQWLLYDVQGLDDVADELIEQLRQAKKGVNIEIGGNDFWMKAINEKATLNHMRTNVGYLFTTDELINGLIEWKNTLSY